MRKAIFKAVSASLATLLLLLCACQATNPATAPSDGAESQLMEHSSFESFEEQSAHDDSEMGSSLVDDYSQSVPEESVKQSDESETDSELSKADGFDHVDDMKYMLIFNPKKYSSELVMDTVDLNERLSTGSFGKQVDPSMKRADDLPADASKYLTTISQSDIMNGMDLPESDLSGDRAGKLIIPYKTGDKHSFYCGDQQRVKRQFTCVYAGEKGNIWLVDGASNNEKAVQELAKEFDEKIYDADVSLFGEPRFEGNGAKVNLLLYNFTSPYVAGFFCMLDLFADGEVTAIQAAYYGVNTDHAIIHINLGLLGNKEAKTVLYSTVAHEFQHLICGTAYFENGGTAQCGVWLNEAMSGLIEEKLYEGVQEANGRYESLSSSNLIRHGQSMYDFTTLTTFSDFDIGVYGSVFLFGKYLEKLGGEKVFHKIHDYWRMAFKGGADAEAIYNAMPKEVIESIDAKYDITGDSMMDKKELWLSKLVLDFYLAILNSSDVASGKLDARTLLYDEINPARIYGGGRVLVAVKDESYNIPKDAGEGLVYVGLDGNFQALTSALCK